MSIGAVGIRAIEYYLPPHTENLIDLKTKGLLQSEVNRLRMLGYDRVNLSENETAYDMALRAGRKLLAQNIVNPAQVDILVCGHTLVGNHLVTEDSISASLTDQFKFSAFRLQHELGLTNAYVLGLSQLTCASFIAALQLVDALIANNPHMNTAMIICADRFPINKCREITFTVLSDGSCATLVCRGWSENRPLVFTSITKGNLWDWEHRQEELVAISYPTLSDMINTTLEKAGINLAEIGLIVPINTNVLSWKLFEQTTGYPLEYIFTSNVSRFGHAMSCDNLINLADAIKAGLVHHGEYILLTAQGLGAHWDCVLMKH